MIGTGGPMATAFDNEESMTHEEILLRFKKIIGREMTSEEKHRFFLPPDTPTEPSPENT
jgi:hypothetical protein